MPRKIGNVRTGKANNTEKPSVITGNTFLYVNQDTRDAIVAALAFLAVHRDLLNDIETKLRVDRVIAHLSDMLYGFEEK